MTNFEYIINHLTERDIVKIVSYSFDSFDETLFTNKIYEAWEKWALSVSPNTGNMAKGSICGEETIKNNPSIWFWEKWFMPNGTKENKGRTRSVSIQVWLSLQYNPKDWEENA